MHYIIVVNIMMRNNVIAGHRTLDTRPSSKCTKARDSIHFVKKSLFVICIALLLLLLLLFHSYAA